MSYRYSIIIPHFNDIERLQRLLNSIPLNRLDIEVLVIDDCSPAEENLKNLKRIAPKIKWYSTEKNSGAGRARNIGLQYAAGKYLLFADSDDEFVENAFERIDAAVANKPDLCYFLADAVQEADLSPSNRAEPYNRLCLNYLEVRSAENLAALKSGHVVPCAKIYSREFIKKTALSFDETMVSNDVAFNVLAAFEAKEVQVVPETVYRIYRRGGSLTADVSAEVFLTRLNVSAQLASRLKERGISYRPSSTGALLASIKYGPKVFFRVLKLALTSDLKFDVFRAFNLKRWYRFLYRRYNTRKELKKNQ